ncbi:MAG: hypothetical protein E6R03_04255 [Hyphomicrobiaceae bacterium]|nr:MAG: hypothetical protein E6R03_04255 [Hyphomicrobiaceae bacterium]
MSTALATGTDLLVYGWEITYRDGSKRRQFDAQEQEIYVAGSACLPKKHGLLENVAEIVWAPRSGVRLPPKFNRRFWLKYQDGQTPILDRTNYALQIGATYVCYNLGVKEISSSGDVREEILVISPPFVSVFLDPKNPTPQFGQSFPGAIEVLRSRKQPNAIDRWLQQLANSQ